MATSRQLISASVAMLALTGANAADVSRNPNRFSLVGRFTFNVNADFTSATPVNDIGPDGAVATTPGMAGTVIRNYDDGFIGVDISGNAGDLTWFWGYDGASQIVGEGTPAATLSLHSAASPADQFTLPSDEEILPGFHVNYARDLGSCDCQVLGKPRTAWYGLTFGFGYTDLALNGRHSVSAPVLLTTDTFAIGAPPVPGAPHRGTVAGPGSVPPGSARVIPDTPATPRPAAVSTPATSENVNAVEGRLLGFTVGPFLEIPLSDRIIAEFDGGLAVAHADRSYSFREEVAIAGIPTVRRAGQSEDADWLVGGTLRATFRYQVNESLDCSLGFQYQNLGSVAQRVNGRQAKVDLGRAFSLNFGLGWRF